jgi:hypothetical protein
LTKAVEYMYGDEAPLEHRRATALRVYPVRTPRSRHLRPPTGGRTWKRWTHRLPHTGYPLTTRVDGPGRIEV